jgi:hypothetical protein
MNNYYQFTMYNKPWNKVSVYVLGIMSAILYIDMKKPEKNVFVKFIVRENKAQNGGFLKTYFPWAMFFLAIVIFYVSAFSSFPIEITPFAWSDS